MTFTSLVVSVALCGIAGPARAGADNPSQPAARQPVVRLAELRIDPSQLELYRAALREEIEASIRLEPGVLTLYAVSVKGDPAQVRIFEVYADAAAYESHLQTSHFKKYKTGTRGMVKSLVLVETDPIVLGAKAK
jgi:quinol monooxygenase YgiN